MGVGERERAGQRYSGREISADAAHKRSRHRREVGAAASQEHGDRQHGEGNPLRCERGRPPGGGGELPVAQPDGIGPSASPQSRPSAARRVRARRRRRRAMLAQCLPHRLAGDSSAGGRIINRREGLGGTGGGCEEGHELWRGPRGHWTHTAELLCLNPPLFGTAALWRVGVGAVVARASVRVSVFLDGLNFCFIECVIKTGSRT